MKFRRVIFTGQHPADISADTFYTWTDGLADEIFAPFGSVDMLLIDKAVFQNECIDASIQRIVTPEIQRKVRIIKVVSLSNADEMPSRFGTGYVHKDGNTVTITECPTLEETHHRLTLFNNIGVYAIRLKTVPERVEIASNLVKSLDMKNTEFVDGVVGSKLDLSPLPNDETLVIDYENPQYGYVHSAKRHTATKHYQTQGMSRPEMGCALAHLNTYRKFLASQHSLALVFEDDTLLKTGDLVYTHRLLFYYPHDDLDYVNFSDKVDWWPLVPEQGVNSMYFKATKHYFNRACAYIVNRHAVNSLFDFIKTDTPNIYFLVFVADDILCCLHRAGIMRAGAPYYKPFTLASVASTIQIPLNPPIGQDSSKDVNDSSPQQ